MINAKFFNYDGANLKEKTSFTEGEKGIFGQFEITLKEGEDYGKLLEKSYIFAPNQKEFENKNNLDYCPIPNHQFLKFLKKNFEKECDVTGGKKGKYLVHRNELMLTPFAELGFQDPEPFEHFINVVKPKGIDSFVINEPKNQSHSKKIL
jgi:hypothetical protein